MTIYFDVHMSVRPMGRMFLWVVWTGDIELQTDHIVASGTTKTECAAKQESIDAALECINDSKDTPWPRLK